MPADSSNKKTGSFIHESRMGDPPSKKRKVIVYLSKRVVPPSSASAFSQGKIPDRIASEKPSIFTAGIPGIIDFEIRNQFLRMEKWFIEASRKHAYPFGSGNKDDAYWEHGGWFRDLYEWTKHDNLNNGYILTGQGYGEEGGRKSIGLTHTVDINGIVKTFSSIPKDVSGFIEASSQLFQSISKIVGLWSEAHHIHPGISFLKKEITNDTIKLGGKDFITHGKMFNIDPVIKDTIIRYERWDKSYR
jgi:hypothetical protein